MKIRLLLVFAVAVCLLGIWWQKRSVPPAKTNDSANIVHVLQPTPVETKADSQAKPEPTPALEAGKALPDEVVTEERVTAALLQRIKNALASGSLADHDLVFSKLLPALMEKHPMEAAKFAESLAAGSLRDEVMHYVARNWTAQDPKAAENWATQLADQDERNEMISSVCFQIAQVNAREAVAIAEQYDLGSIPGAVVENLVQQWAAQDFPGATSWVQQCPAGQQRNEMVARLAFVQSQTSPAEAAQMVVQQIPPGPRQEEAAITVLFQWAKRDMAGASAWVERFPAGALRERAEKELAGIQANQ